MQKDVTDYSTQGKDDNRLDTFNGHANFAGISSSPDVIEILSSLWPSVAGRVGAKASRPEVARALLDRLGETGGSWESGRVQAAREALLVGLGRSEAGAGWLLPTVAGAIPALLRRTQTGGLTLALAFGGQAAAFIDEIAFLYRASPAAAGMIRAVAGRLEAMVAELAPDEQSLYPHGFALIRWLEEPAARPPAAYIQSSPVSQALIFTTQIAHYLHLLESGYDHPAFHRHVTVCAGHSQGIMGAVFAAENAGRMDIAARAADYAAYFLRQGIRMQQLYPIECLPPEVAREAREAGAGDPSPMAAVTGLTRDELESAVGRTGAPITIAVVNARLRQVVSGRPLDLERLRRRLALDLEAGRKARAAGRRPGRLPEPSWQYLPVSAPFHSPFMADGIDLMLADLRRIGFTLRAESLSLTVLDPETGAPLPKEGDLVELLVRRQFSGCVEWAANVRRIQEAGAGCILDFGPGDAVMRLSAVNLKGRPLPIVPVATTAGRAAALDPDTAPQHRGPCYADFMPAIAARLPSGAVRSDNRFTRLTGCPPVILPGMTPTTADAQIVVAAANAGFIAELAGGGQTTEAILRRRLDEIARTIDPGRGIVVNTLRLDPYLWKLHLGPDRLLIRLRDEGYPIIGVTISAGVPPIDEAAALLRELNAHGMRVNAFKPGNDAQVREVAAIADACPDLPIIVQIEGGNSGGHHSWEDLDDLLARHYDSLRERENIVLAAGGGIASPDRACAFLTGAWSAPLGLPPMPVDAIFTGTRCMAALEARTTPAVKRALAEAAGTERWVTDGESGGGVVSGRSQLDAPIHYLDNAAARAGRLLDELAGDPAAISARRHEIIAALGKTAKPFFGDPAEMTCLAMLRRLATLTAVGRHGPYEDGVWPDASYRRRFAEIVRMLEARLAQDALAPFQSILRDDAGLDDPHVLIDRFAAAYPDASRTYVHPDDVRRFVEVCRKPGKPVNFVPIIDADVRRWYKSDSLWQAHDERFGADEVLTLPGPASVAGVERPDEPVAEILAAFESRLVAELVSRGVTDRETPSAGAATGTIAAGEGEIKSPGRWFETIAGMGTGPVAAAIAAPDTAVTGARGSLLVVNPLRTLLAPRPGFHVAWIRDGAGVLSKIEARDAAGICARVGLALGEGGARRLEAQMITRTIESGAAADAPLDLFIDWVETPTGGHLWWDHPRFVDAQRAFFGRLLFGRAIDVVGPFSIAEEEVEVTRPAIAAFVAATGDDSRGLLDPGHPAIMPAGMAFAFAWAPIFRALTGARPDMLRLLHETIEIDASPAWPVREGDRLRADARIVAVQEAPEGRRVTVRARLTRDGVPAVLLTCGFLVRRTAQEAAIGCERHDEFSARIRLHDEASRAFLLDQPFIIVSDPAAIPARATLDVRCHLFGERRLAGTAPVFFAEGDLVCGGCVVGKVSLTPEAGQGGVLNHPVAEVCRLLAVGSEEVPLDEPRLLGRRTVDVPASMRSYALAGGDLNPLHVDTAFARFAGFDAPIAHGMWTASAALAAAARIAGRGDEKEVRGLHARFLAPVMPGEEMTFTVRQSAMRRGAAMIEIDASVKRGDEPVTVLSGRVEISPPRTAWALPGQGVQAQNMGMEGYARSAAARAVWDEAERICREKLGFSILRVVRENPREIVVDGTRVSHPKGVLFLTQFTQVAMVVMAVAQVRELRERGVFTPGGFFCGHSVGEYSALAAIADVLPLECVVDVVYNRGLTMDRLVARDASGRSPYAMGVILPHRAGMGEGMALALVARIAAETGLPLEVVNYNIRGRQYSVTGHVDALARLAGEIERGRGGRQAGEQGKAAYLPVPGIDVPFHSTLLRDGVPLFRATLERVFPREIPYRDLVGVYIPNLVAKPYSLERAFVEEVATVSGSPVLAALLAGWDKEVADTGALARTLLIELLAYQFASPVRWIETQDLLFHPQSGVDRFVEVGVAHQPTLANMARATLSIDPSRVIRPQVLNSEADFAALFGPVPVAAAEPSAAIAAAPEPGPATAEAPRAAAPVPDLPFSVREGLFALLALQAKVRPDQISPGESIDALFGGNSSRRNQVLSDISGEFAVTAIDGAHEAPIGELVATLASRAVRYREPGRYLAAAFDQSLARALGVARVGRSDVLGYLATAWGLPPGRSMSVLGRLAIAARDGASTRGGNLSATPTAGIADRPAALAWLDRVVDAYAREAGVPLVKPGEGAGNASPVDAAALAELNEKVLGADGVLARTARFIGEQVGIDGDAGRAVPLEQADPATARLAVFEREHGAEYAAAITPCFDPRKHVAFTSSWAWRRRDAVVLDRHLANGGTVADAEIERLARLMDSGALRTVETLARAAEDKGRTADAGRLRRLIALTPAAPAFLPGFAPRAPFLEVGDDGGLAYREVLRPGEPDPAAFVRAATSGRFPVTLRGFEKGGEPAPYAGILSEICTVGQSFAGRTALVTGAGPGSIALAVVRALLLGGARVVATTSSYGAERIAFFKKVYEECAAPGAELHVVPANQGSLADMDALSAWVFEARSESKNGVERTLKEPWVPDLILPFAAGGETADLTGIGGRSIAMLRVLLVGVERLIARLAEGHRANAVRDRRLHVVLPLSPNHGMFGGDGAYGESKAALEALLEKWRSEHDAWGRRTSIVGARIGWVRGTGLMDQNNALAARIEAESGVRTFSTEEMALLIAGLMTPGVCAAAAVEPLIAGLCGGIDAFEGFAAAVGPMRDRLTAEIAQRRRRRGLDRALREALHGPAPAPAMVHPRPACAVLPPIPSDADLAGLPELDHLDTDRVVVIVGYGEVGPWGSARTRWEMERDGALSRTAIAELAWMMGLIRPGTEGAGWVDAGDGSPVDDASIEERYGARVLAQAGIRTVKGGEHGFDPAAVRSSIEVRLDRDLSFTVTSREAAEECRAADPTHTRVVAEKDGSFSVVRTRGAVIRAPRAIRLDRDVAGQVPAGWDATRYGVPREMAAQVDRVTLFNLVATAEAFAAAGVEPEEIHSHIHPSKVGCTQGSGIGGMQYLKRLYRDFYDGAGRQNDTLQETLINVIAGYVVQAYLGSYGPMSFPAGACATAAVSIADAVEKIQVGAADLVVAGGADDYGEEGAVGFADMGATAATGEMAALGVPPGGFSRPNDRRRGGFVEAQGAGALILCRASVAIEMGLPVYGIVAYAGSFGDGINRSVPAPGMGPLAAAAETRGRATDPRGACDFNARRACITAIAARRDGLAAIAGPAEADLIIADARRRHGHDFFRGRSDISPLRGALAVFGLGPDDIAVASKHDTSTLANDLNENRLHDLLQKSLGRTPGLPLAVISQKALTGHPKGAAAAWQIGGLMQAMADGVVPPNPNLTDVDSAMHAFEGLVFSDEAITVGRGRILAGLATSLGFGHVGALICMVHPHFFWRLLPAADRAAYAERLERRLAVATRRLQGVLAGTVPLLVLRTGRPFDGREGSPSHIDHEARVLSDAAARFDQARGTFTVPPTRE